jgi:hypothetical protein
VVRQLMRTAQAINSMHQAVEESHRAANIRNALMVRLGAVPARTPKLVGAGSDTAAAESREVRDLDAAPGHPRTGTDEADKHHPSNAAHATGADHAARTRRTRSTSRRIGTRLRCATLPTPTERLLRFATKIRPPATPRAASAES